MNSPGGSKKCAQCNKSFLPNQISIQALGKTFHENCFVCVKCGCLLQGSFFRLELQGTTKVACENCYEVLRSNGERCATCNELLLDCEIISALGKQYHAHHFVCAACGKPVKDGFFGIEGRPYCKDDMVKLTKPKCGGCGKLILDQTLVNAFDAKWHPDCFKCASCGCVLINYYEKNGKGYCDSCHNKASGSSGTEQSGSVISAETVTATNSPKVKQKQPKPPPTPRYMEGEATELADLWGLQREITDFEWPKSSVQPGKRGSAVAECGWPMELGSTHVSPSDTSYKHMERQTWYATHLAKEEHKNFFFVAESPCIISIEAQPLKKEGDENIHRVLVRTAKSDDRMLISLSGSSTASRKVVAALKACHPALSAEGNFVKCSGPELIADLIELERRLLNPQFKFGVLYCKPGQKNEDDFYHNVDSSAAFNEFLNFLGERVELIRHTAYTGGLSTKDDSTGTHSVYRKFSNYEIMFHVSTYIPYYSKDKQQVERKRHIGNDVVVIIFRDGSNGNDAFHPETITSHFNHIFAVVEPLTGVKPTTYQLSMVYKPGVKPHKPFLPYPCLLRQGSPDSLNFLLTKLINAEIASMESPEFLSSMKRTRRELLEELVVKHKPKYARRRGSSSGGSFSSRRSSGSGVYN